MNTRRMTGLVAMVVAVVLIAPGVVAAPSEAGVKKHVVKQNVKVKYGNAAAGAINSGGYGKGGNINVNTNNNQNTNIIKVRR